MEKNKLYVNQILGESYDDFVNNIFPTIHRFDHHNTNIDFAASLANKEGLFLEFGVYTGTTIKIISKHTNLIYGFDSFEGLPEDWNFENLKGAYNLNGVMPELLDDKIKLVKGLFNESLPKFINDVNLEYVSFIHFDADLYSSTKCVFDLLTPFFKKNCVLVFDEFCGLPDGEKHEYKAFYEFLQTMEDRIESFYYIGRSATSHYANFSVHLNFK